MLSGIDNNFFTRKPIILGFVCVLHLLIFWQLFGFHFNNDTDSFIATIEWFRGREVDFMPNRYLNPLYPIIGAYLLPFLSPAMVLIALNIIFFVGMIYASYGLWRRVFQDALTGFVAALILVTNYSFIRYGLTQVQDMGGYFWYVLTLYSSWRWFEDGKRQWLWLGGVAVAAGLLTKESGAMGALFFGALLLCRRLLWRERLKAFVEFSILPFVTLIVNGIRGAEIGFTSLDWYRVNWEIYGHEFVPFKWAGVNASTFNVVWFLVLAGIWYLIKNLRSLDRRVWVYLGAVVLPSASYFAWPIFISRTVIMSAWLLVPIGAYGLIAWYRERETVYRQWIVGGIVLLTMIMPFVLQHTLRYARMFQILEGCDRNLVCAWDYFWEQRDTFSTIK